MISLFHAYTLLIRFIISIVSPIMYDKKWEKQSRFLYTASIYMNACQRDLGTVRQTVIMKSFCFYRILCHRSLWVTTLNKSEKSHFTSLKKLRYFYDKSRFFFMLVLYLTMNEEGHECITILKKKFKVNVTISTMRSLEWLFPSAFSRRFLSLELSLSLQVECST